jgi:hypothetical protein
MSKKTEDEKFQKWIEERGAELPVEKQEAWRAIAETDWAKEELFRGTIRADKLYTELNKLNAEREKLYEWYEEEAPKNEALIAERDILRAQVEEFGSDNPPAAGASSVSAEVLADLKAKADMAGDLNRMLPVVLADSLAIVQDASKNGFEYDPQEVMRVSLQKGTTPFKAYEFLTQDQRKLRYDAEREAERKKWVEEGRRQAISASNGSPDHIPASGPSVIDMLRKDNPEVTPQDRVRKALELLESGTY